MAKEVLAIPEDNLLEVVGIIRAGLRAKRKITPEVYEALTAWCDEEEAYMRQDEDGEQEA